jgi:hypothetical protein
MRRDCLDGALSACTSRSLTISNAIEWVTKLARETRKKYSSCMSCCELDNLYVFYTVTISVIVLVVPRQG